MAPSAGLDVIPICANCAVCRMKNKISAQSATEYLMTYGWAVLLVSVVVIILFQVNPTALFGYHCTAISGFGCNVQFLTTNGVLSATISQFTGEPTDIYGVACSTSALPNGLPSFGNTGVAGSSNYLQSVNNEQLSGTGVRITSGSSFVMEVQCYGQGSQFQAQQGTQFDGTIWINYTTPSTPGYQVVQLTTLLTAPVSSGANISITIPPSSNIIGYVPIVITPSGSTAAPFQQMLTIDSASFSSDESGILGNVEFTTGPNGAGATIPSWIESGDSNASSSTVYWLKFQNGLPPGSTTIYMDFGPMTANYFGGANEGVAPQLTNPYGLYDNGASVFNMYDDFKGQSLSGAWSQFGSGGVATVNNGLTIAMVSTYSTFGIVYQSALSTPFWLEGYLVSSGVNGGCPYAGFAQTPSPVSGGGYETDVPFAACTNSLAFGVGNYEGVSNSNAGNGIVTGTLTQPALLGLAWPSTGSELAYSDGTQITASDAQTALQANEDAIIYAFAGGGLPTATFYYVRARAYPPGGVMPSYTVGSLQ